MANALHEPITGVWGRACIGAPGGAPEAETHSLFDAQTKAKFGPLSRILQ